MESIKINYIYVLMPDGAEWEDLIMFISREEAIEVSKKYKRCRVKIFEKTNKGYEPSYNYYRNGLYYSKDDYENPTEDPNK